MDIDMNSKYERLLELFEEISKTPRKSGSEKEIALFVCNFAEKLGLEHSMDNYYNVIVKRPADEGMEEKKKLMFQAHLDMVCEKVSDSNHDFSKDPIDIIKSEGLYTANGTTLGADDGIGVSILLLLMETSDIKLPLTYFVFTTQEETGMAGAKNIDFNGVDVNYLINLDSEEENSIIVGCAGGVTLYFEKENHLYDISDPVYQIEISGLKGGHSGVDIDKNRVNAICLSAKILSALSSVHLISFNGGTKTNVIPSNSTVVFSTKSENMEEDINSVINNIDFCPEDKDLSISVKKLEGEFQGLSELASKEIISLLLDLQQGVISKADIVETSGNIAIIEMNGEIVKLCESMRSNVSEQLVNYRDMNITLADSLGFIIKAGEEYPGWDYNPKSNLIDLYVSAYQTVHNGEKPIISSIHAGLECGLLKDKLSDVDIISIGPDVKDVHTPNERLHLDSCKKLISTIIEFITKID
ncbi:MAG: beta-Ala-His dipeptidase [Bacilli bacterium]|nr:beta-Ala-His dipeptidase [Bacilli bacterium]